MLGVTGAIILSIGWATGRSQFAKTAAAMEAAGLETTKASAHFQSRAARSQRG
jgi:hypothetical protein